MKLAELIDGAGPVELSGGPDTKIRGLAYDNRRVNPGDLYFCVPGVHADGHDFAGAAAEAGAAALVCERRLPLALPQVRVADARAAMAPIAANFFGQPSHEFPVVAITGTNGKTTTAWLLREILAAVLGGCGLIGTVQRVIGGEVASASHTTPEAIDLQADFRQMIEAGDQAAVIEASSHALALHRCDSTRFAAAVFTNLTQDHLDFHGEMEPYFAAKRKLFELAPEVGIINLDDEYGAELAAEFGGIGYSAAGNPAASLRAEAVSFDAAGSRFRLIYDLDEAGSGEFEARIQLPGHFNVANALAAIGAAARAGVAVPLAAEVLAEAARVPGRFEPVDAGQDFTVLVDYAHTPDSLENVLRAARRLTDGRLIAVFGAGGDRDRDKRPKMGRAGALNADQVVITSDNPRSEEPERIVAEVAAGTAGGSAEVSSVVDRREAIATAIKAAEPGDVVVIAGKGHEQGQEFENGHKIPFDDRVVAAELLAGTPTPGTS